MWHVSLGSSILATRVSEGYVCLAAEFDSHRCLGCRMPSDAVCTRAMIKLRRLVPFDRSRAGSSSTTNRCQSSHCYRVPRDQRWREQSLLDPLGLDCTEEAGEQQGVEEGISYDFLGVSNRGPLRAATGSGHSEGCPSSRVSEDLETGKCDDELCCICWKRAQRTIQRFSEMVQSNCIYWLRHQYLA